MSPRGPGPALYPYNWKEVEAAIRSSKDPEAQIQRIEQKGIGLHLYGKVTSKKAIEDGSVVAAAIRIWGLDIFNKGAISSSPATTTLQGPKVLHYPASSRQLHQQVVPGSQDLLMEKMPGAFRGIDAVFVRGVSSPISKDLKDTKKASLLITVRDGSIAMGTSAAGSRRIEMDLGEDVTMAQLNLALSRIRYLPPSGTAKAWSGSDQVTIQVTFGEMQRELIISVLQS